MKISDNIIEYIVLTFLEIRDNHNNKFMNIITNLEESACTVM